MHDRRVFSARWLGATVALLLLLGAGVADAASGRALYDKGVAKFEKGDYEAAAALFAGAYAAEPDPAYLFSEASCHRRLGKDHKAAELYEMYLTVVPAGEREDKRAKAKNYAAEAWLRLAAGSKEKGDCRGALPHLDRAIELQPENGEAWIAIGHCQEATGSPAAALRSYEEGLKKEALPASMRAEAAARVEALKAAAAKDASAPPKEAVGVSAETDPKPVKPKKRAPLGLIFGIGGGVVAAGAAGLIIGLVLSGSPKSVDVDGGKLGVARHGGW